VEQAPSVHLFSSFDSSGFPCEGGVCKNFLFTVSAHQRQLFFFLPPAPGVVLPGLWFFQLVVSSIFARTVCGLLQELVSVLLLSCRIEKLENF
jgi:hypothetical protein